MNERIEKLVIEAFFDESTNGADQKMYTLGEEKIQKFAELIVRECCVALHPMLRDMISRDQGVHLIEKHFGDKRINERIEKMAVQAGFEYNFDPMKLKQHFGAKE